MSAVPIGSIAFELISRGGGGPTKGGSVEKFGGLFGPASLGGTIAGIVGAITTAVIGAIRRVTRMVMSLIRQGISSIMADRERLGRLDPTAAMALVVKQIRTLMRDLGRARMLGGHMLAMTEAIEGLKDTLEPTRRLIEQKVVFGIATLVRGVDALLKPLGNILGGGLIQGTGGAVNNVLGNAMFMLEAGSRILASQSQGYVPILLRNIFEILNVFKGEAAAIKRILNDREATDKLSGTNSFFMDDLNALTQGGTLYRSVISSNKQFTNMKPLILPSRLTKQNPLFNP